MVAASTASNNGNADAVAKHLARFFGGDVAVVAHAIHFGGSGILAEVAEEQLELQQPGHKLKSKLAQAVDWAIVPDAVLKDLADWLKKSAAEIYTGQQAATAAASRAAKKDDDYEYSSRQKARRRKAAALQERPGQPHRLGASDQLLSSILDAGGSQGMEPEAAITAGSAAADSGELLASCSDTAHFFTAAEAELDEAAEVSLLNELGLVALMWQPELGNPADSPPQRSPLANRSQSEANAVAAPPSGEQQQEQQEQQQREMEEARRAVTEGACRMGETLAQAAARAEAALEAATRGDMPPPSKVRRSSAAGAGSKTKVGGGKGKRSAATALPVGAATLAANKRQLVQPPAPPHRQAARNLQNWSAAEDALIRSGIESFGRKWGKIAAQLPGRSDENCRSRWSRLPPATGATAAAAPHGL